MHHDILDKHQKKPTKRGVVFATPIESLAPLRDFLLKMGEYHFLTFPNLKLHANLQIISIDGRREKSRRTDGQALKH